jgi:hypothetical protein
MIRFMIKLRGWAHLGNVYVILSITVIIPHAFQKKKFPWTTGVCMYEYKLFYWFDVISKRVP